MKSNIRKCSCGCKQPATGGTGLVAWASIDCAVRIAEKRRAKKEQEERKAERKRDRDRKEAQRPLTWYKKTALKVAQEYARIRDKDDPCISCNQWPIDQDWHGGHFMSVGSSFTWRALNPRNIHKQCNQCNTMRGGNHEMYKDNLIIKEGAAMVEFLEGPQQCDKPTREDLIEVIAYYRALVREASKEA